MRTEPRPYEIFTHFKGNKYQIVTVAIHSETGEKYVVYQAMYGDYRTYVRPYDMFMGEVDHEKYPEITKRYRFYRDNEAEDIFVEAECIKERGKSIIEDTMSHAVTKIEKDSEEPADISLKEAAKTEESEEAAWQIDPLVMEFLDADTYEARLNILAEIHPRVTDDMINTMAVASNVEINEGPVEERFEQLKYCLITRSKYERKRY